MVSSTELQETGEQLSWSHDDVVGVILLPDILRFVHSNST